MAAVVIGAGDGIALTALGDPAPFPLFPKGLLVKIAGDDYGGRHRVEDTEDPYPHHQLLQLLCLGAVVLHDGPDPEEGNEAGQQEGSPDEQVHE